MRLRSRSITARRAPTAVATLAMLVALAGAAPAQAQWAPVPGIPAGPIFTVWANGDTIVAGADSVVFISLNAGATWARSAKPVAGVSSIQAVWVRNGRLYAGTFGQGVHVSDDLGRSWHPFNEGLVGGFLDSQLDVTDLQVRGDSLYAATAGAGVYLRNLASAGATWRLFGTELEPNQASNVNAVTLGGSRLIASAGSNGMVFLDDPGATDWTVSNLDNVGIHAGVQAQSAAWTGTGWVVGTNAGLFLSSAGEEPWTRFDPRVGPLVWTAFATQKNHLYAAFVTSLVAVLEESVDDGASWTVQETQPAVFIQKLAIGGNALYAARGDGLWRRLLDVTGVAVDGRPNPLRFAVGGAQPFGDRTLLRFELPRDEAITIEIFDVRGRSVGSRIEARMTSGAHELPFDAQRLGSGVYLARLTAGGSRQVVRLVHVR